MKLVKLIKLILYPKENILNHDIHFNYKSLNFIFEHLDLSKSI